MSTVTDHPREHVGVLAHAVYVFAGYHRRGEAQHTEAHGPERSPGPS